MNDNQYNPYQQHPLQQPGGPYPGHNPNAPAPKPSKNKNKAITVILVLMLICVAVLIVMLCMDKFGSKKEESTNQNAATYFNQGLSYFSTGDYQAASQEFTKVIGFEPENANAYYQRAMAYMNMGLYQAAIDDFTRASSLNPDLKDSSSTLIYSCQTLLNGGSSVTPGQPGTAITLPAHTTAGNTPAETTPAPTTPAPTTPAPTDPPMELVDAYFPTTKLWLYEDAQHTERLEAMPTGTPLFIEDEVNGYAKVTYRVFRVESTNGNPYGIYKTYVGWCNTKYLSKSNPLSMNFYVHADAGVPMYDALGSNKILLTVPYNAELRPKAWKSGFALVSYNGKEGWIEVENIYKEPGFPRDREYTQSQLEEAMENANTLYASHPGTVEGMSKRSVDDDTIREMFKEAVKITGYCEDPENAFLNDYGYLKVNGKSSKYMAMSTKNMLNLDDWANRFYALLKDDEAYMWLENTVGWVDCYFITNGKPELKFETEDLSYELFIQNYGDYYVIEMQVPYKGSYYSHTFYLVQEDGYWVFENFMHPGQIIP